MPVESSDRTDAPTCPTRLPCGIRSARPTVIDSMVAHSMLLHSKLVYTSGMRRPIRPA
jgi:hypothetical protein